MKNILILAFLFLTTSTFSQCLPKGDSPQLKLQRLDSLKNRTNVSRVTDSFNVTHFLSGKYDVDSFHSSQFVKVTGYIVGVKYGGSETCNCHSKNKQDLDFHIELAAQAGPTKNIMVCEVSRFTRGKLTIQDLKALVGKKVTITGWLFFDEEHKQNAINTNPQGTNLWRGTCWEVHPAFTIVHLQ